MSRIYRTILTALLLGAPLSLGAQDTLRVAPAVDSAVMAQPLHALCAMRWVIRAQSIDIDAAIEALSAETVSCAGYPVLLVRPVCLITLREAPFYLATTPLVMIRCPNGAATWRTGRPFPPLKILERA